MYIIRIATFLRRYEYTFCIWHFCFCRVFRQRRRLGDQIMKKCWFNLCWCRTLFFSYRDKNRKSERTVSVDVCGNRSKLRYEWNFKIYQPSTDTSQCSLENTPCAEIGSVATVSAAVRATHFLVLLFQSHHKMAVSFVFFYVWFTFLNSFILSPALLVLLLMCAHLHICCCFCE